MEDANLLAGCLAREFFGIKLLAFKGMHLLVGPSFFSVKFNYEWKESVKQSVGSCLIGFFYLWFLGMKIFWLTLLFDHFLNFQQ
jgi:hypothetical protein